MLRRDRAHTNRVILGPRPMPAPRTLVVSERRLPHANGTLNALPGRSAKSSRSTRREHPPRAPDSAGPTSTWTPSHTGTAEPVIEAHSASAVARDHMAPSADAFRSNDARLPLRPLAAVPAVVVLVAGLALRRRPGLVGTTLVPVRSRGRRRALQSRGRPVPYSSDGRPQPPPTWSAGQPIPSSLEERFAWKESCPSSCWWAYSS